jgi:hypothetical protein
MAILEDTDPSSPEALRQASTEPAPRPGVPQVQTEPGLGPSSQPAPPLPPLSPELFKTQPLKPVTPPPMRPMNIVVPATSPVPARKDSVELLLDGMAGPQPERPKMTPQTDGQSSAVYHAQHGVRPARTSPEPEPKVVVERPALPSTTRIDRAVVQKAIAQAEAKRRALEATAVVPQRVAPRVIVAIVAGLMVVLGLFVVARLVIMRGKGHAAAAAAPSSAPVSVPAASAPAAMAAAPPTASTAPAASTAMAAAPAAPAITTAAPSAASPSTVGSSSPAPSASVPWWLRPRAKPAVPVATAPATGGKDLGEFKTSFH